MDDKPAAANLPSIVAVERSSSMPRFKISRFGMRCDPAQDGPRPSPRSCLCAYGTDVPTVILVAVSSRIAAGPSPSREGFKISFPPIQRRRSALVILRPRIFDLTAAYCASPVAREYIGHGVSVDSPAVRNISRRDSNQRSAQAEKNGDQFCHVVEATTRADLSSPKLSRTSIAIIVCAPRYRGPKD